MLEDSFVMDLIPELERTRDEVLLFFELDEEKLGKSYAPGKWTVRELLHHIADAEMVLAERIKRGIAKPGQVVWGFDQDAWCASLDYARSPITLSKNIFEALRNSNIHIAKNHLEKSGGNGYVHNETGMRTVKDEMEKLVRHSDHHLMQIKTAIEHPSSS